MRTYTTPTQQSDYKLIIVPAPNSGLLPCHASNSVSRSDAARGSVKSFRGKLRLKDFKRSLVRN